MREIFAALGLAPEEEPALVAALASLPDYRQARQDLLLAEQDRDRAAAVLGGKPSLDEETKNATVEALEEELAHAEATAAREVALAEEIAGIESLLREARQRHDLEAALARRDEAVAALRAAREEDYEAVAGWVLAAHLRRETRDRHQPPVLRRARELFSEITRRRYELRAAGGEVPSLAAYDAETGREQALAELSSGTRLQLLLAVRMAFVEHQEAECAPPIFLDETLATSDPERTAAVIEAVAALAARGRQVFAFMAQPEEVGKWLAVLEDRRREGQPVAHAVIDLAAARRLAVAERRPLAAPAPRHAVPSPGALDRLAYGRLLGVPALDPWTESVGGVHIWHLVADPAFLYPLLAAGFERWGPAEALLERGAARAALGPGGEATLRQASACARALAAALETWRIGRGRTVDRAALATSGAVSQVFLDLVDELCSRVGGDARRLLSALEQHEVKHFYTDKRLERRGLPRRAGVPRPAAPLDPRPGPPRRVRLGPRRARGGAADRRAHRRSARGPARRRAPRPFVAARLTGPRRKRFRRAARRLTTPPALDRHLSCCGKPEEVAMQVKEIMTRDVECIPPDTTLQEAARRMRDLDVGPLPICEGDRLTGILTDRDITIRAVAEGRDPKSTTVREVMSPDVFYCFEDQEVAEAARLMKDQQIRRVLILDRQKRLVGIVSLGDLAIEAGDDKLSGSTLEAISEPAVGVH